MFVVFSSGNRCEELKNINMDKVHNPHEPETEYPYRLYINEKVAGRYKDEASCYDDYIAVLTHLVDGHTELYSLVQKVGEDISRGLDTKE